MNQELLQLAANQARGLALDAVHKSNSGHLGLPLGGAEIGATLFGSLLQCDPADPKWLNRDRFILSAGHGSMFLYSWLAISGYDLPMSEVANFRQLHSKPPDIPNFMRLPAWKPPPAHLVRASATRWVTPYRGAAPPLSSTRRAT